MAGPLALEIPPADDGSITGTVMDAWQAPQQTDQALSAVEIVRDALTVYIYICRLS